MFNPSFRKGFSVFPQVITSKKAVPAIIAPYYLLLETNDFMLLESEDKLVMET